VISEVIFIIMKFVEMKTEKFENYFQ